jgi:prepilin-type N-terminal cleavage/methylation domain-containing protein
MSYKVIKRGKVANRIKRGGMTLAELMVSVAVFSMLLSVLVVIIIKANRMYRESEYIRELYSKVNIIGQAISKTTDNAQSVDIEIDNDKVVLKFREEEGKEIRYYLYKNEVINGEGGRKYYIVYGDGRKREFEMPKEIEQRVSYIDEDDYRLYNVELYVYNLRYSKTREKKLAYKVSMIQRK